MLQLDWASLLFQIVNFLVLLALLSKFLFKPLRAKLDERGQRIADLLANAQEREAEAAQLRDEWEQRLSQAEQEREAILTAPSLAAALTGRPDYLAVCNDLSRAVAVKRDAILEHAAIDNVNIRGNRIEQEITGGVNVHDLGDMVRPLRDGTTLHIEIKTKLLDRASAPKAYNVDKALQALGDGRTAIAFCFVGVDLRARTVCSSVVSIFDRTVLNATCVQFHWAGRNSRGVTQLTGNLTPLFRPAHQESVDVEQARAFLEQLLGLE